MNKDKIKVVKRNKKDGAEKPQVIFNAPKVESDTRLKIVTVVNNWISERRENSRAEKVFSDSRISAWKLMSRNF
ncbi:MAG TPA: hypothetical protein VK892_10890 [Pyrinomonadaceae bacterium]|nr:hypothetical protein [Pyrinomonadaceae bacterium]